ncbi:ATP-binding protein [Azospirillum sp.]|uniref:ATP-binding protein n=1 Tax=Azospirillum sp. TaxID=34012 RepID=UPI002D6A9BEC|nr:ATP-binding protein [Azospirillum sp.]HYD68628.1 ATP-binding protein [Azospirillum sp.]
MSIRQRLIVFTMVLLAPVVLAAGAFVLHDYGRERAARERGLQETARALALAVDRQLGQAEAMLRALATSPHLASGDHEALHRQARAAAPEGTWVVAQDSQGRMMWNGSVPFGTPMPEQPVPEARSVLETGRVHVSDMRVGRVTGRGVVGVNVPVVEDGKPTRVLSLIIPPSQFRRVLSEQGLEPSWVGTVLDRKGTVIARTRASEQFEGRSATPDLLARLAEAPEGVMPSASLEGDPTLVAYSRSPVYGWTFVIAVPRAEVEGPVRRSLLWLAAGGLAIVALAALLAALLARTIARPVEALAGRAAALGRGEPLAPLATGLTEVDAVGRALHRAGEELRRTNEALEERVAQAVAEVERTQAVLVQAQKLDAIGQLTGGVAHDFNNLLQALSGCLQMLDRRTSEPRSHELIRAGLQAVDRGAKLTQQLMAFARRQALRPEPTDVRDRLLGMSELLARALRADIRMDVDFAPGLWPVLVDPTQLELAVLNIVVNARDAMPDGGRLHIAAANVDLDAATDPEGLSGSFVRIDLADSGMGMPPDVLARVFEPFFTTKPVGKGSGLGLAMVYGFARQSGGAVRLSSAPGQGTTVILLLPRATGAPCAAAVRTGAAEPSAGRRVLQVEDDAIVGNMTAAALTELGYTVVRAGNADEALAVLAEVDGVDVLFTDVVLPGGQSGIDLAREARRRVPDLPVVLATGYSESFAGAESLPVLPKPYRLEALVAALESAMAERAP